MNDLLKEALLLISSAILAIGILSAVNHFIINSDNQNFHESAMTFQEEPKKLNEIENMGLEINEDQDLKPKLTEKQPSKKP